MALKGKDALVLERTFKLFLEGSYGSVSIADLEKATGMARGTILYKIGNKDDLFRKVVRYYIIESQNPNNKLVEAISCNTLKEFIENYIKASKRTMKTLSNLVEKDKNGHRCYFSLLFDAAKFVPGFAKDLKDIFNLDLRLWEINVNKAFCIGEIRRDLNPQIVAKHFRFIFSGLSFERAFLDGLDTSELEEMLMGYYDMIKNDKE
ncbi:MAG: TetR/AcrR family transcriptional regulator [Bacteroidales bacterium]